MLFNLPASRRLRQFNCSNWRKWPLALVLTLMLIGESWAADVFVAARNRIDIPPFGWVDTCSGNYSGYGTLRMERLMKDLGYEFERRHIDLADPEQRVMLKEWAASGVIDVYAALPKGVFSEEFVYGDHPFLDVDWAVFYPSRAGWHYQNWDSLKNRKGLIVLPTGSQLFQESFHQYAKANLRYETRHSYLDGFAELAAGKADYILAFRQVGIALIESQRKHPNYLVADIEGVNRPVYLAVARTSPLIKRLPEIDQLLRHYKVSGLNNLMVTSSMKHWLETYQQGCVSREVGARDTR